MAEIRLNYTAGQINALLDKINNGETLTNDEKTRLLNINLSEYVKDDYNLILKIQNEITKSASYSILRTSTTRVVLGRYIIRYNDLENTLDFSYTDNDIIAADYEIGSIDNITGQEKEDLVCIRTVDKIEVDPTRSYSLFFLKPAYSVSYYIYANNGTFLMASNEINTTNNQKVNMNLPGNAAYIKFKFKAPEQTASAAFALANYVDLYRSVGVTVPSSALYEPGSINATTGVAEENADTVRTTTFTNISSENKYIVTVPGGIDSFRFYFYNSSKTFISCTEPISIPAGGSTTVIPPTNAAYMKFKFAATNDTQSAGLIIGEGITITSAKVEDLTINWVEGEYDEYGDIRNYNPNRCVRTENPIPVEAGNQYQITFGGDVRWFRYYFYSSSGAFLNRSDGMDKSTGDEVTIIPPASATTMTMKFGTEDPSWEAAKAVADQTVFRKIAN